MTMKPNPDNLIAADGYREHYVFCGEEPIHAVPKKCLTHICDGGSIHDVMHVVMRMISSGWMEGARCVNNT